MQESKQSKVATFTFLLTWGGVLSNRVSKVDLLTQNREHSSLVLTNVNTLDYLAAYHGNLRNAKDLYSFL